ncbi:MAG TPA: cupin domain-containing protein [Rhodocyclaceae bacterium]|nr:cupin domain-containing protein [Rhodocyclaceae bacterium]
MNSLIDFNLLPQPAYDSPAPERCIGTPPQRTTWSVYQGDKGEVDCGIWACEPGAWRIAFHERRHEYFHVLEGRIRITGEDGEAKEFGPGDACVIPAGFRGVFEVLERVRKHYVMIDRA